MKAILTKFYGPSNVKGSRISASDSDGNRVVISTGILEAEAEEKRIPVGMVGDALHELAAYALCRKMSWTGKLIEGSLGPGQHVFVFLKEDENKR